MTTPAEMYAEHVEFLAGGIGELLALEVGHNAVVEQEVDGVVEALATFAEIVVERVREIERAREGCAEWASRLTARAGFLGLDDTHTVPSSRIPSYGAAGALYRAALRGREAVVFELASLVASRAAKEM